MKGFQFYTTTFFLLTILLLLAMISNLYFGATKISLVQIYESFFTPTHPHHYIIFNYRLPKVITAMVTGASLGISGLLMQTYFKNPLAGPFVLGISSGASLGVAVLIMGGTVLTSIPLLNLLSIPIAASLGALLVLLLVMITARNIKNSMSTLIIGLMFGNFTTAFISILSYFTSAEQLQQYVFWSLGSMTNLQWTQVNIMILVFVSCGFSLLWLIKPLNALLLGDNYAKSMGVNLKQTQTWLFIITSLLTGCMTAFVGPIAFIGMAIPHMTKLIFPTSNHQILLPATAFVGAITLIGCDTICNIQINNLTLPINAITSLVGAPVIVWLLIRKSKRVIA